MTESADATTPPPPPDPELVRRRQEVQLEVWSARERSGVETQRAIAAAELEMQRARADAELGAAVRSGLYERLAFARAIAESDLVPAGFRAKRNPAGAPYPGEIERCAASIVLAQEWGSALGLAPMASLMHLQVIEGNIGLKPASARGMMNSKGIRITDDWEFNVNGIPVKCVTSALRPDRDDWDVEEYTLEDAVSGRLCTLERGPDGEIVKVIARSSTGKPLNWEKYTRDMLRWRATSRLMRAQYMDVVGGMNLATDYEPETITADSDEPGQHFAVPGVVQQVAAERADRRNGGNYDPTADLEMFTDTDPWWNHSGRNDVKRRTKKQMAADRLAAVAGTDDRVPTEISPDTQPLSGEIQEDDPAGSLPFGADLNTYAPNSGPVIDVEELPTEPDLFAGAAADPDPDPWAGHEPPDDWEPQSPLNKPNAQPETRAELLDRLYQAQGGGANIRRHILLLGDREPEDWTDDEIRQVLGSL